MIVIDGHRVTIDGVDYVRRDALLSDEGMRKLAKAYTIAFGYGVYDPDTRPEHLREVWRLLSEVNNELHFKD